MSNPSHEVISAVAAADDVDPKALDPPLHDVLDVEALDRLLDWASDHRDNALVVSFEYAGYQVTVSRDGRVELD